MPISNTVPTDLLLCLRPETDPRLLSEFSEDTWANILQQARRFDLTPLLYQRIVRERPGLVLPAETTQEIRGAYYATLAENTRCYHTLAQALAALHAGGSTVLLLKGAHLAELVYGDIGLRPMADFDLLVSRLGLLPALDLLRRAGFEPRREYSEEADGALHRHAPALIKDGAVLEVHWDLTNPGDPLRPDLAGMWARAVPAQLQEGKALALAPVDLLLYLCVHSAYSHSFHSQLYALCDIREVLAVQGEGFDWQAFIAATKGWNACKGVYLALRLAAELVGAAVPAAVLAELEPPGFDPGVLAWAQVNLFRQTLPLSANFNRVMLQGNALQRLRALWAALFPTPAAMTFKYGAPRRSWRLMLFYPYTAVTRLVRLRRHALSLLNRDPQRVREAASSLNLHDWLWESGLH